MGENKYFTVSREENKLILKFLPNCSSINAKNYAEIEDLAEAIIEDMVEDELIFDLDNVIYVSSAGLRMFSSLNTKLQDVGIGYQLINLMDEILKMFQLTGYSSMFKVTEKPKY